jgi:endogenous inhibitor of DNA gyrase (YacG/DUF329 family)
VANLEKPCPICGKPMAARFRPFCSARCADVDLGRWFTEGYAVPTTEPPEPPDDDAG